MIFLKNAQCSLDLPTLKATQETTKKQGAGLLNFICHTVNTFVWLCVIHILHWLRSKYSVFSAFSDCISALLSLELSKVVHILWSKVQGKTSYSILRIQYRTLVKVLYYQFSLFLNLVTNSILIYRVAQGSWNKCYALQSCWWQVTVAVKLHLPVLLYHIRLAFATTATWRVVKFPMLRGPWVALLT